MIELSGRSTFITTLAFAHLPPHEPELRLLHRYLDSRRGIGDLVGGMHRAGWDVQMTEYGDGHWRATFYVTGQAHSIIGGSAWEPAPWRAVQKAASEALRQ